MTFKFYLRMVAVAMTMLLMAPGCSESDTDDNTPPTPPDPTKPNYTFVVTVNEKTITDVAAEINVKPSDNQATYHYGAVAKEFFDTFASDHAFLVNDIETLKNKAKADNISLTEYLNGRLTVGEMPFWLSSLLPGTEYYAYAYGITKNGEVTSELAKAAFTTAPPALPLSFEINVSDIKINGATVTVTPSNSTSFYFYDVFEKAEMDKYENDAEIIAELSKVEGFSTRLVKGEQSFTYSETNVPLKPKTTYYAYAFEYGNPNVTEPTITKKVFTTKSDDPFNATYESWLGKWEVESTSSLVDGKPLKFTVEITQKVAGTSYNVKGWSITRQRQLSYTGTYAAQDVTLQDGTVYKAGSILIQNQQTLGAADSDGFSPAMLGYSDDGGKPGVVTGGYYALTGTLSEAGAATMESPVIQLQGGNEAQIVGAEIFALNMTAGKFKQYYTEEGYKEGDYPVGPYTMTWKGSVEPPTPPVGGLTFTITTSNITESTISVQIQPSNNTDSYYFDLGNAALSEKSDAEIIAILNEAYAQNGGIQAMLSTGPDQYDFTELDANTTYYVLAFGYDASGATTAITRHEVSTTAGGGQTDGPQLTLSARAGDANGLDTDTKGYVTAKCTTAETLKYNCWPKSVVDDSGQTLDEIITQYGKDGNAEAIELLRKGLALTYRELDPATTYSVIFKVTDAAGKSTIKRADFTTTAAGGGGGEATDAYNAWLGTWTVTSTSSEVTAKPLTFDIYFEQKVVNASYVMGGMMTALWRDDPTKYGSVYPIAEFNADGTISVKTQKLFSDSDADGEYDYIYNIRWKSNADGKIYVDDSDLTGLRGSLTNSGATITGSQLVNAQQEVTGNVTWMDYYYWYRSGKEAGKIYGTTPSDMFKVENSADYPIGPFTLVKKAAGVAPRSMSVPFNFNTLSSVMRSEELASTQKGALSVAMEVSVDRIANRSTVGKNISKRTEPMPDFTNNLIKLGSTARYMSASGAVSTQGAKKIVPLRNTVAPFKIVNARYE